MKNPLISALEPRLLFDGAAVATAVEVLDENSFEQNQEQESKEEPTLDKNSNSNENKVVFVDSNLKDLDTIVNDLQESNMEVKLIDDKQDSIKQIINSLDSNKLYDEIHILSHGSKGEVTLGNTVLNSSNIDEFKEDLNQLSTKLNSGADILLYGCEIAKDEASKEFVDKLAAFTKADIATSDDLTGSDALNANWDLEYSTGEIQAETIVIENYDEVLSNAPDLSTSKLINDISPDSLSDPGAYNLFDDDINTNFQTSKGGAFTFSVSNSYIAIDTITFTTTTFLNSTSNDLYKFALYGSKDGLTYDNLIYENNSLNPPASRGADYPVENINNSEPYGYYKIRFKNAVDLFEDIQLSGMKITGEEFTFKSYTENESEIQILDDANISDTDSSDLQGATISISEGFNAGDILAFNNNDNSLYGSITPSYDSSTGELNLSGNATLQQYENALKAVTYHSTSDSPTINSANRTFSWQVNDGTNDSNVTKSYLSITAVNDVPQLIVNDGTGNIQEDGVLSDSGSLTLVDVDEVDTTSTTSSVKSITGVQSDGITALNLTTAQESALDKLSLTAGNSSNETIQWDYTVSQSDIEFIGEGERVTVVYTITSEDNNGASVSKDIEIEILGSNNEPTLTVNNVNGNIEEGSGNLNRSGSIDYEDKDSTDIVTASLNSIDVKAYREDGSLYTLTTQQDNELKNAFSLVDTGGSNKGSIQWEYNITEDKIDFLAKDESVILRYEIDIQDSNGGDKKEEVEVEITGTNDTPNLIVNDGTGNIQEDGVLSDSGSLTLVDVDEVDTTSTTSSVKSITGVQSDGITALNLTTAQESALDKLSLTAGNSSNETIQWDYTVSQSDIEFIGEGERVTVVYTITSEDNNGASVSKDIEIEILGSNNEPTLTVNNVNGNIEEGSGNLNRSGSIDYEDKDSTDIVTASLNSIDVKAYREDGSLYTLTTQQDNELKNAFSLVDTGGSNKGSIQWEYNITEDKIDFLAKDESVILRYEIDIQDSNGGDKKEEVEVEITGTNDTPNLIVNDGTGNIQEDGVLSDSGSLTLVDVDLSNSLEANSVVKSINAYYSDNSMMILDSNKQENIENAFSVVNLNPGENTGDIKWSFDISEDKLDFLAQGESITAVFTVKVSDNENVVTTQDITIEIKGANDTPTITSKDDVADLKEAVTLDDSGFINIHDLDLSNKLDTALTASTIESYKKDGTALELTIEEKEYLINALGLDSSGISNNSGTLTWSYEVDESKIDFLSEDEKVKITYTIQISDGFTSINEDIEVNITGTNDKPTITSNENLDVYKIYNGTFSKDYSTIFSDVDRTDFLTYEFEGLPKGLSYDSSTGVVSGVLEEIGTFNISIKAYDNSALQESISKEFVMKVLGEEPGPRAQLEYIENSTTDLTFDSIVVNDNIQNERLEGVISNSEDLVYEVGKGFIEVDNQLEYLSVFDDTKTNIIKDAKIVINENNQLYLEDYINQDYDSLGLTIEEITYKDEFIELKIDDSMQALKYEVFVINEQKDNTFPVDIIFDEENKTLKIQANTDVRVAIKAISEFETRTLVLDIKNNKLQEVENSDLDVSKNSISFKDELKNKNLENENYGQQLVKLFEEAKS
ncbi:MAG: DUF4347 domain-containing protein [Campylobacterota bacterium]